MGTDPTDQMSIADAKIVAAAAMKTGEYVGYRKAINALRDPGKYVDKIGAPVDLAGHAFFAALLESIAKEVLAE